jgi:malate/lactate dehydrogenase
VPADTLRGVRSSTVRGGVAARAQRRRRRVRVRIGAQSQLVPELSFFACRVKLGMDGVEEVVGLEFRGLSDYEARALDALKPQLRASIDRAVTYVQQYPLFLCSGVTTQAGIQA